MIARIYSSDRAIAANANLENKKYWLSAMRALPERACIPCDHQKNDAGKARVSKVMLEQLAHRMVHSSNDSALRMHIIATAAVFVLLHKYTGKTDLIVGIPVYGNQTGELLLNPILPIRSNVDHNTNFRELLQQVRKTIVAADEHQHYPMEILIDELGLSNVNAQEGFPLFDVMVMMEGVHDRNSIQDIYVDILLLFRKTGSGVEVVLEYNAAKYAAESMKRLLDRLEHLLLQALLGPHASLASLDMVLEADRHEIARFNSTAMLYDSNKTIPQLFDARADLIPDNIAVCFNDEALTYAELKVRSDQVAAALKKTGVHNNEIIGLLLNRSMEMAIAILGVVKSGAAYLPLSLKYPGDRIRELLEQSKVSTVLTQPQFSGRIQVGNVIFIDSLTGEEDRSRSNYANTASSDLLYVIYTSGSTGKPKGVMVTHKNVHNLCVGLQHRVYEKFCGPLHIAMVAPYEFDASVQQFFGSLLSGHTLHIVPEEMRLDGSKLWQFYNEQGIEASDGTPSHIRLLLESKVAKPAASLKQFVIAGEVFPKELALRFIKLFSAGIAVSNVYGPTETTVDSTVYDIMPGKLHEQIAIPIGVPLANEQVYILGPQLQLQPVGVAGEIYIGGDGVASGYMEDPLQTGQRFIDHPFETGKLYKTGDLGRLNMRGELEYLGRSDDQVKLRGYRIEPGEIEYHISVCKGVQSAAVIMKEPAPGEMELCACIVPDPEEAFIVKQLVDWSGQDVGLIAKRYTMPNGMTIFYLNRNEIHELYKEVFEDNTYSRYGISLPPDACIVDIGSNIGMFCLYAHQVCPTARIYAVEPIPAINAVLKLNLQLYGINSHIIEAGISSRPGEALFTYYPYSSGMSGLHASKAEEAKLLETVIANTFHGKGRLSSIELQHLLNERLVSEEVNGKLKTLSEIIREHEIEKIDLLKIDVEKSELDVLQGIDEQDWGRIDQLIIEVHDREGRLKSILSLLQGKGYYVRYDQDLLYSTTELYNVYASRQELTGTVTATVDTTRQVDAKWQSPEVFLEAITHRLKEQLPAYMIPASLEIIKEMPLNANGKTDRRALGSLKGLQLISGETGAESPLEQHLQRIWQKILLRDRVGVQEDFFTIGGNSIRAIRILAAIHKELHIKVQLSVLFKAPTIKELANILAMQVREQLRFIPKAADKNYYPLSPAQRQLYFLQRMRPDTIAYNLKDVIVIEGDLDKDRLADSFKALIRRHEILRTGFEEVHEAPVQKVYEQVAFEIDYVEISDEPGAPATDQLVKSAVRSFSLDKPPLIRVRLIREETRRHILVVDMHHIVSDGISHDILVKDFMKLYEGDVLPPLKLQYKDFSDWQNSTTVQSELDRQEAYWLRQFDQPVQALRLPYMNNRSLNVNYEGATISFSINEGQVTALKNIAREERSTLYMVLLTSLYILLHKITGQNDIVIGCPASGRLHADLEGMVGLFVNTLALRNYPADEKNFAGLLQEVTSNTLEAFKNQEYPLEALIRKLKQKRDLSHNPLFDVAFTLQNQQASDLEIPGLIIKPYTYDNTAARFDLAVHAIEAGAQLIISFTYKTRLIDRETIVRIIQYYQEVIAVILSDRTIPLKTVLNF